MEYIISIRIKMVTEFTSSAKPIKPMRSPDLVRQAHQPRSESPPDRTGWSSTRLFQFTIVPEIIVSLV